MAKQDYSKKQQKIISNYYDNLDNIMLTKLQELVTELFLVTSKPKADKLWTRVDNSLVKLKIKEPIRKHIMAKKDIQLLASHLNDWLK